MAIRGVTRSTTGLPRRTRENKTEGSPPSVPPTTSPVVNNRTYAEVRGFRESGKWNERCPSTLGSQGDSENSLSSAHVNFTVCDPAWSSLTPQQESATMRAIPCPSALSLEIGGLSSSREDSTQWGARPTPHQKTFQSKFDLNLTFPLAVGYKYIRHHTGGRGLAETDISVYHLPLRSPCNADPRSAKARGVRREQVQRGA